MEHGSFLQHAKGAETIVCNVWRPVNFKTKKHRDEQNLCLVDVLKNRASFAFQCCRTCDPCLDPELKMLLLPLFYMFFHYCKWVERMPNFH